MLKIEFTKDEIERLQFQAAIDGCFNRTESVFSAQMKTLLNSNFQLLSKLAAVTA